MSHTLARYVSEQADDLIEEGTDWQSFAQELDVSEWQSYDGYPEWTVSAPFERMLLVYLWSKVEGESPGVLRAKLENNTALARAFGFDPSELPSESTFRPCRLKERFEELEYRLTKASEAIRTIARERGAPLGANIGDETLTRADQTDDPSERTIQRLLRKRGFEVLEELRATVFPAIGLPRPDNPIYDNEELLTLESVAALSDDAANSAGQTLGDKMNPDPDIEGEGDNPEEFDPFYEDGPSGETLLEAIKALSVEEIATLLNFALKKTYHRAKPRLQEIEHDDGSRFGTRAKVALDITYVAYYGQRDEMEWVQGAPDNKSYRWCHKFATAVIVGDNTHYTVAVCPLGSTEYAETTAYPGEDNTYYIGDVARRLLDIANDYVNIRTVYADREFHAVDVLATLEYRGLDYVIPAVKNNRIKRLTKRFDALKRGYDDEGDTELYVQRGMAMHGPKKNRVSNAKVYTKVVVLPPDEDDETHEEGSPQPFLTNLDLSDETPLDRKWATKQIEEYNDRGAIENSYSSIKEAAAWTSSKTFEVRWFHFGFGCLVYNLWLLVDFLTQERIGVIETRKKPRITLSRFLNWLDDKVIRLLE